MCFIEKKTLLNFDCTRSEQLKPIALINNFENFINNFYNQATLFVFVLLAFSHSLENMSQFVN